MRTVILAYEFLSISPLQNGNGRLSRLLTTLSLLNSGYAWIQYVSFEHEIERTKTQYYCSLPHCWVQRPEEDVTEWVKYFLSALVNVQKKLANKAPELTIRMGSITLLSAPPTPHPRPPPIINL